VTAGHVVVLRGDTGLLRLRQKLWEGQEISCLPAFGYGPWRGIGRCQAAEYGTLMEAPLTVPGPAGQQRERLPGEAGAEPVTAHGHSLGRSPDRAILGPGAGDARWANDRLISIRDIREIFSLGRTAAYELTHRPEFPRPVLVSPRCYRWWASEVGTFAASLRPGSPAPRHTGVTQQAAKGPAPGPATPPRRITGRIRPARARRKKT